MKRSYTRHGKTGSKIQGIWKAMIRRCHNPRDRHFKNYGGRGILVCERWRKFENFYADMGDPPAGLMLERRDNSQGYFPENCCWDNRDNQNRNMRSNIFLTHDGVTLCLADWAKKIGLHSSTLFYRVRKLGWPIERALTLPAILPVDKWKERKACRGGV